MIQSSLNRTQVFITHEAQTIGSSRDWMFPEARRLAAST